MGTSRRVQGCSSGDLRGASLAEFHMNVSAYFSAVNGAFKKRVHIKPIFAPETTPSPLENHLKPSA